MLKMNRIECLVCAGRDEEEDEETVSAGGSRAQYVSANCVVFTHYTGDVASVVDQHFTRALSYASDKGSPGSDKGNPLSTISDVNTLDYSSACTDKRL